TNKELNATICRKEWVSIWLTSNEAKGSRNVTAINNAMIQLATDRASLTNPRIRPNRQETTTMPRMTQSAQLNDTRKPGYLERRNSIRAIAKGEPNRGD